jgi:hypothetical protein
MSFNYGYNVLGCFVNGKILNVIILFDGTTKENNNMLIGFRVNSLQCQNQNLHIEGMHLPSTRKHQHHPWLCLVGLPKVPCVIKHQNSIPTNWQLKIISAKQVKCIKWTTHVIHCFTNCECFLFTLFLKILTNHISQIKCDSTL